MAAEDSKTPLARDESKTATGCMLGRACSLIMIPRLDGHRESIHSGSLNRELMHP